MHAAGAARHHCAVPAVAAVVVVAAAAAAAASVGVAQRPRRSDRCNAIPAWPDAHVRRRGTRALERADLDINAAMNPRWWRRQAVNAAAARLPPVAVAFRRRKESLAFAVALKHGEHEGLCGRPPLYPRLQQILARLRLARLGGQRRLWRLSCQRRQLLLLLRRRRRKSQGRRRRALGWRGARRAAAAAGPRDGARRAPTLVPSAPPSAPRRDVSFQRFDLVQQQRLHDVCGELSQAGHT
mmetsp:Transcript_7835/g.23568  ORF Transcript_7835/g.23568 Transcript_7835/m.23568 type:complete len:240 (-) Transcript_7835:1765-2484(-)